MSKVAQLPRGVFLPREVGCHYPRPSGFATWAPARVLSQIRFPSGWETGSVRRDISPSRICLVDPGTLEVGPWEFSGRPFSSLRNRRGSFHEGQGTYRFNPGPLPLLVEGLRPPAESLSSAMRMEIGVRSRLYFSGLQAEGYKVRLRATVGMGRNRRED